jgi:hypothetical protein
MQRLSISLVSLALATPACLPTDADVPTGHAELRLTSQAPSGRTYRLRHADFDIAGPQSLVLHTEDDPTRTAIDFDVVPGDYTFDIEPGWYLERLEAERPAVTVNATLLSPAALPFTIADGAVTPIALRFQVGSDVVDMARGTGEITVEVDDQLPAIQSAPGMAALDEGSAGPIFVTLSSRPAGAVVVTATASAAGIAVSPATITFTPDDYDAPHAIMVAAAVDDNDHADDYDISLASADATPLHVGIHVFDRDGQGIILTRSSQLMLEGSTVGNSVRLRRAPSQPITVTLAADHAVTISPATLTFTPDNYDVAQLFTITAPADGDNHEDGALVTAAGDQARSLMIVRVLDTGAPPAQNIIVDGSTTVIAEGGTLVGGVRLMLPPTSPVTVQLHSDSAALTVSPAELTFTADNWNVNQPVTLTAVEDTDRFDDRAWVRATAIGLAGVPIEITILDNDR